MNEEITKKEFYKTIRDLKKSYNRGDIEKELFYNLVRVVGSAYYGQKLDKMLEKHDEKYNKKINSKGNKLWKNIF